VSIKPGWMIRDPVLQLQLNSWSFSRETDIRKINTAART